MTRPNNAAGVETAVHVRSQGEVAVAELATDGPPCPHCNGTGRIVRAKDNLRVVGRCSCQRLPDRIAIFNRAGLPARHATSTLQSFEVNSAFIEVSRWRQRFEGAVCLDGPEECLRAGVRKADEINEVLAVIHHRPARDLMPLLARSPSEGAREVRVHRPPPAGPAVIADVPDRRRQRIADPFRHPSDRG